MIFRNERGGILLAALATSAVSALTAYWIAVVTANQVPVAIKSSTESVVMSSSQSLAALIKLDFHKNFEDFKAGTSNWAPCNPSSDISSFLQVLNSPPSQACAAVAFRWTAFHVAKGGTDASVPVSQIIGTLFHWSEQPNNFHISFRLSEFNLNPERNQVLGEVRLTPKSETGTTTSVRLVIDLQRTLSHPLGDASCRICRTIAGSVCCTKEVLNLAYLDASGRFMNATFDPKMVTLALLENPVVGTSRTNYYQNSLCPTYSLDVASDTNLNYALTMDGRVLASNGAEIWATPDPKMMSISYLPGEGWFVLRSDGAVFRTTLLSAQHSFVEIQNLRLPLAEKLVMGSGPSASPCP